MKKFLLLIVTFLIMSNSYATNAHFEIYGVDSVIKSKILACCKNDIDKYIKLGVEFNSQQVQSSYKQADLDKMENDIIKFRDSILKKINKLDNFSIAEFSNVYYPADNSMFSTLDIVRQSDAFRLPISPQRHIIKDMKKSRGVSHLLTLWDKYTKKNEQQLLAHPQQLKEKPCPFAHCTSGFDKTEQKEYVSPFKKGAIKYKTELKALIEHSDNEKDRGNAIFLLANSNDYIGLAHYLIHYTTDSSSFVRNNSMRVLDAILEKHIISGFDITPFITAINYPKVTDRNKALYVLFGMVQHDKSIHSIVIQKSGQTLINLLKLNQPCNHNPAFQILKEISKKNYAERDYQSWEKWVASQQTSS